MRLTVNSNLLRGLCIAAAVCFSLFISEPVVSLAEEAPPAEEALPADTAAPSEEAAAAAEPVQPEPLTCPGNLRAYSEGSCSITLTWDEVPGADGYLVYRMNDIAGGPEMEGYYKIPPAAYTPIARLEGVWNTAFVDTSVLDYESYEYTVAAYRGELVGPRDELGVFVHTACYSETYDIRIYDITSAGFVIQGRIAGFIPGLLRAAIWTDAGGQDDIVWYNAEISGDVFTFHISTANHWYQWGIYDILLVINDRNSTVVYADVPPSNEVLKLTNPLVLSSTAEDYTVAANLKTVFGIGIAKTVSYPAELGPDYAMEGPVEIRDNAVYGTVRAADFNGMTGDYITELVLTDVAGNQISHRFEVVMENPVTEMTLTQIDVGHGDAALLASDGEFLLIDAARSEYAYRIIDVLKLYGVEHLSILITHRHSDHTGGLFALAEQFQIDCLYMDQNYDGETINDEIHTEYAENYYNALGIPIRHLTRGDVLKVGKASVNVIGPAKTYGFSTNGITNNNSKWLYITDGKTNYLTCGDTEFTAETDMLALAPDLSCTYEKISHHGIPTGSKPELIAAAGAEYTVMSTFDPVYVNPIVGALRDRFLMSGAQCLSTSRTGSVSFRDVNGQTKVYYLDEYHRIGRMATYAEGIDYSPVFDPVYYAMAYPEVTAVYGTDPSMLFAHFWTSGMKEGRRGNEAFDLQTYVSQNPYLQEKFGTDWEKYYIYYITGSDNPTFQKTVN